jgi:hypothetical protein
MTARVTHGRSPAPSMIAWWFKGRARDDACWTGLTAIALGIAAVALREGRDAWRDESCCTAPITVPGSDGCTEDCCSTPAPTH